MINQPWQSSLKQTLIILALAVLAPFSTIALAAPGDTLLTVPGPLHERGSRQLGGEEAELAELSHRAFSAAMEARLKHFAGQGYVVPEKHASEPLAATESWPQGPATLLQTVGGTNDEPTGSVPLTTDPSLSCPGFYVVRTHALPNSQAGRLGTELLIQGSGRRTLQGGLNFGGRASTNIRGFSGFTIANQANEMQVVNLGVSVFTSGRVILERRSTAQGNTTYINQTVSSGDTQLSATVPPGFYVVAFEPFNATSTAYAISALTSYVNRPGGGFQGGVVVGGFHDPARASGVTQSTGFAGFCISEPYNGAVRVESRPTYGSSGATGIAFTVSSGAGQLFLDSRTPEAQPQAALGASLNRVAGWPGLLLDAWLNVDATARPAFLTAYEMTSEELDALLDATLLLDVAELDNPDGSAIRIGIDMDQGNYLGDVRALANGQVYLWPDIHAIALLPGGEDLVDDLLMELVDLGLGDIAQALNDQRPLRLIGFEQNTDPTELLPDPAMAQDLSRTLNDFVNDHGEVTYVGMDGDAHVIAVVSSGSALKALLEELLGEFDEDDLDNPGQIATTYFWIEDNELVLMAVDIGQLDGDLNVQPATVLLAIFLQPFAGTIGAPDNPVIFDLCRLPEDMYEC
jgi:hypothetical protein